MIHCRLSEESSFDFKLALSDPIIIWLWVCDLTTGQSLPRRLIPSTGELTITVTPTSRPEAITTLGLKCDSRADWFIVWTNTSFGKMTAVFTLTFKSYQQLSPHLLKCFWQVLLWIHVVRTWACSAVHRFYTHQHVCLQLRARPWQLHMHNSVLGLQPHNGYTHSNG